MPQPLISKLRLNVAYSQQAVLATLVYNGSPPCAITLTHAVYPLPLCRPCCTVHAQHAQASSSSTCPLANAQVSLMHVMQ